MKFLPNTDQQDIATALLSGQKSITIDGVEFILKELKRDTRKNKEIEANKMAKEMLLVLAS